MKQKKKIISGIDIIGILLLASIIWAFIYFLLAWIFGVSIDVSISSTAGSYGTEGTSYSFAKGYISDTQRIYSRRLFIATTVISLIIPTIMHFIMEKK